MEELINCIFGSCLADFAQQPAGAAVLAAAAAIALLSLYKMRSAESVRSRILWSYPLLFSPLLALAYFSFAMACHAMSICDGRATLYGIPFAAVAAFVSAYLVLPWIFTLWKPGMPSPKLSKCLPAEVPVYTADNGKPYALSLGGISRRIVVSQGLVDLLSRKELEAVLLHEYGHIMGNASLYLSTRWLYSKVPFVRSFMEGSRLDDEEELLADSFAAHAQKTSRHLNAAKKKLKDYFSCRD